MKNNRRLGLGLELFYFITRPHWPVKVWRFCVDRENLRIKCQMKNLIWHFFLKGAIDSLKLCDSSAGVIISSGCMIFLQINYQLFHSSQNTRQALFSLGQISVWLSDAVHRNINEICALFLKSNILFQRLFEKYGSKCALLRWYRTLPLPSTICPVWESFSCTFCHCIIFCHCKTNFEQTFK